MRCCICDSFMNSVKIRDSVGPEHERISREVHFCVRNLHYIDYTVRHYAGILSIEFIKGTVFSDFEFINNNCSVYDFVHGNILYDEMIIQLRPLFYERGFSI